MPARMRDLNTKAQMLGTELVFVLEGLPFITT